MGLAATGRALSAVVPRKPTQIRAWQDIGRTWGIRLCMPTAPSRHVESWAEEVRLEHARPAPGLASSGWHICVGKILYKEIDLCMHQGHASCVRMAHMQNVIGRKSAKQ